MIKIKNLDIDTHAKLIQTFGCYIKSCEQCTDIDNTVDIVLCDHVKLSHFMNTTTLHFRDTSATIYNYNYVEIKII